MRIVIQRVKRASVSVEEKVVGSIQKGFLVLIGVGQGDDEATADKYMKKPPELHGSRRAAQSRRTV